MLILSCLGWATAGSAQLRLDCFQTPDKALTVHAGGDFVDPYFAARALITARQIGSETEPVARQWIRWALAHQLPDGRFARYCREDDGSWHACVAADADDAVLALWRQLLYLVSPEAAHRGKWQPSSQRAGQQLAALRDPRLGVYVISQREPVALFMDNAEIYDAQTTIAQQQQRIGATKAAKQTRRRAADLAKAINRVFWREDTQRYFPASKGYQQPVFYPHVVGQVYAWLFDLPTPLEAPRAYTQWLSRHGERWLAFGEDKYPWGLAAAAADKLGDTATARQWLRRAEALRYTDRWNILEEAIFQSLSSKYSLPVNLNCTQERT